MSLSFIFFGGIYFLFDNVFQLAYLKALAWLQSILYFIGTALVFLPQFFQGFTGMPRRYIDYPEQYEMLNNISIFGSLVCAVSVVLFIFVVIEALVKRRKISQ